VSGANTGFVREMLTGSFTTRLAEDRNGVLWVATDNGLYRIEDGKPVPFGPAEGLNLTALLFDRDGNMWMATRASGVLRYDGEDLTRFVRSTGDGLADIRVYALYEDRAGRIWAGTLSGASAYDGTAWKNYGTTEGLVDKRVSCFAEDREGRLWIGTQGGQSLRWQAFREFHHGKRSSLGLYQRAVPGWRAADLVCDIGRSERIRRDGVCELYLGRWASQ